MKITKINGYSERSEGAAMLIILDDKVIAMFEMKTNTLTATIKEMNPESNEVINNITKGWATDIKKIDHDDFSKIVFDNFRYVI